MSLSHAQEPASAVLATTYAERRLAGVWMLTWGLRLANWLPWRWYRAAVLVHSPRLSDRGVNEGKGVGKRLCMHAQLFELVLGQRYYLSCAEREQAPSDLLLVHGLMLGKHECG